MLPGGALQSSLPELASAVQKRISWNLQPSFAFFVWQSAIQVEHLSCHDTPALQSRPQAWGSTACRWYDGNMCPRCWKSIAIDPAILHQVPAPTGACRSSYYWGTKQSCMKQWGAGRKHSLGLQGHPATRNEATGKALRCRKLCLQIEDII